MKKEKTNMQEQLYRWQWAFLNFVHSKTFRVIFMATFAAIMLATPVLASPTTPAAETIWTRARAIMQDVYSQIILISTIAAVVTAAVALLLMNFSKNNRTVDESRAWLKRIIISWAILNGLGFIMAYITPFFAGGTWSDTGTPTPTTR